MSTATPSSAHASATMRANRGADTGPEVALRAALHACGLRFRKNARLDLAMGRRVRPDIIFSRLRLAIFVDGCFWHGCQTHGSLPTSNRDFWMTKFDATAQRDAQQTRWLIEAGWTVIRVWEHDVPEPAVRHVRETIDHLRTQRSEP